MSPFLFVALDDMVDTENITLEIAETLAQESGDFGFKVNLDFLLEEELWSAIDIVSELGRPVFADLKMFNGARTMASIIQKVIDCKVDYLSVYALADEELRKAIQSVKKNDTKILGVTILTHYDDAYCKKHFCRTLGEAVRHFAETAIDVGCDGIIVPGTTLGVVSDLETIKVVPGIRPGWYKDSRHKEEITPATAVEKGADILVCGGPIMKADDPVEALHLVLSEMNKAIADLQ